MNAARRTAAASILVLTAVAGAVVFNLPAEAAEKVDNAALERTRKQVRMLDDLYKTAVVLITTHYVEEDSDLAAGEAALALFAAMKEKGWHEVRLLDASGEPINDDNSPKDSFEKSSVKKLKAGEAYVDKVVMKEGKPYLRAATPIPVVLEKCIMCHPNYKDVPEGQPIGVLGYTIPIE